MTRTELLLTEIRDTLRELVALMREPDSLDAVEVARAMLDATRDQRVEEMARATVMARAVPRGPEQPQ